MRQHRRDLSGDGPAGDHRTAEITPHRPPHEAGILREQRLVGAKFRLQRRHRLRRRLIAQDHQCWIARDNADDDEDQRQHRQQGWNRGQETARDEEDHSAQPRLLGDQRAEAHRPDFSV